MNLPQIFWTALGTIFGGIVGAAIAILGFHAFFALVDWWDARHD